MRDAAYAALEESARIQAHERAARWLEQAGESDALIIAEHFLRGGLKECAASYLYRAAEQALERSDLRRGARTR